MRFCDRNLDSKLQPVTLSYNVCQDVKILCSTQVDDVEHFLKYKIIRYLAIFGSQVFVIKSGGIFNYFHNLRKLIIMKLIDDMRARAKTK